MRVLSELLCVSSDLLSDVLWLCATVWLSIHLPCGHSMILCELICVNRNKPLRCRNETKYNYLIWIGSKISKEHQYKCHYCDGLAQWSKQQIWWCYYLKKSILPFSPKFRIKYSYNVDIWTVINLRQTQNKRSK